METENRWDSKFLGTLVNDRDPNRKLTTTGNVGFEIEIIAGKPSDFPAEANKVTTYSNKFKELSKDLSENLFEDSEKPNNTEIQIKLAEYFNGKYFSFDSVEGNKSFYTPIDDPKVIDGNELSSIPVFKGTPEEIVEQIEEDGCIQVNADLSLNEANKLDFIIIIDEKDKQNKNYYLLGPFKSLEESDSENIRFILENESYFTEVFLEELAEHYIVEGNRAFVEINNHNKLNQKLEETDGLTIEELRLKIIEKNFLKKFEAICVKKGLVYKQKDLINFHTAMKTQSLVVLSGMSGIGKSKLVEYYYEAFYTNNSEETVDKDNFLFVPVRPFWQDDSDLIGYLDTLNNIYRPGESGLIDFIIKSSQNKDELHIVCLDEMNLARVEHYFSQFLSILERDPGERILKLYNEETSGRVFNESAYPAEIEIGDNILFVGTVNLDESTFSFSDKVLDRANVINLQLENFRTIKEKIKQGINESYIESIEDSAKTHQQFNQMRQVNKNSELTERELDFLWDLHLELNKIRPNLGIGMRIIKQIEIYLANLPATEVIKRKEAFDLQIIQRIITKIKGSKRQLEELIGSNENYEEKTIDGSINKLFEKYEELSDFDRSKDHLKYLRQELAEYGHTI